MLSISKQILKNEKGMAVIEMIPMLLIIVLFFSFTLGFFGAIQSGILNSIGARNYTLDTFQNKSNLVYFRSDTETFYQTIGARAHGVRSERKTGDLWHATDRAINPFETIGQIEEQGSQIIHNQDVFRVQDGVRYTDEGVSHIWLKQIYGICLWSTCEPL